MWEGPDGLISSSSDDEEMQRPNLYVENCLNKQDVKVVDVSMSDLEASAQKKQENFQVFNQQFKTDT